MLSDTRRFKKTLAGWCMIAAPAVLLVAMVLHPRRETEAAAQLSVIADDPGRWYAAHLLVLITLALAVPAVLGLVHMLRERQVALGHLGGALALAGILAVTGIVAIDGLVGWQMTAPEANRAEMVALLERVQDTAGVVIPLFAVSFALGLGFAMLAAGLYRARVVQSWTAAAVGLAGVALTIAGPTASAVLSIGGAALLLAGLAPIGRMALRESEQDWEHRPDHPTFHPLH